MTIIECPFCDEILEVEAPDKSHISVSVKPIPKNFHGDIIRKEVRCTNEDCKKTVTVYWIAPIEFFSRM